MPQPGGLDLRAVEAWIRDVVRPVGPLELVKERPWATVLRVPIPGGQAFFKACRPVQSLEPRLTAALAARWPDRVAEVLAFDDDRGWLLTADAGAPLADIGNPPERWLELLPRYAELQVGEAARVGEHLEAGVPDLRTDRLAEAFVDLVGTDLPIDPSERLALRGLAPVLGDLADDLAGGPIDDSLDHADLHLRSAFAAPGGRVRVLDWGDASVAHPFLSPFVTFHWLRDANGLRPDNAWFPRLRDAYLEPWGAGLVPLFAIAQRVAPVARALAWLRHHRAMGAGAFPAFDEQLPDVLRAAATALRQGSRR